MGIDMGMSASHPSLDMGCVLVATSSLSLPNLSIRKFVGSGPFKLKEWVRGSFMTLSAVDTYTEEEILSRLRGVMRERTSLIVSHRISTVRDADVIFVLDDGRIAERGTHEALIRRNGLYAALHKKQLLEEELAAS